MNYTHCPHCKTALVEAGFLKEGNYLQQEDKLTAFLKKYTDATSDIYCDRCLPTLKQPAKTAYFSKKDETKTALKNAIDLIPILNISDPQGWEYQAISLVSAQTVMGTGFLSELKSDFSDIFSLNSNNMSGKLSKGEITCFNNMKQRAVTLGANAIVGVDIDYAEVGSLKGMLMVCTTGTAVNLKNPCDVLGEEIGKNLSNINSLLAEMKMIQKEYPFEV